MAKTKDKSFEPDAEELEEDVPPTDEEWEKIVAEEEDRREECAVRAVKVLIDLAQVPSLGQQRFREEVVDLMHKTFNDCALRDYDKRSKAFAELEQAIRTAWVATHRLTKWERNHLDLTMRRRLDGQSWGSALAVMGEECARLTGKNPYPYTHSRKTRGRRRGDIKDYPLKRFVESLVHTLSYTGGHLTLDVKGERGSWVKALDVLRPLLPSGFIPKEPPLSTIERWIRGAFEP